MIHLMRAVRVGLAVPVVGLAAAPAAAGDHRPPVLTGGAYGGGYGPWWGGPPGWVGPGPAWGPYRGWGPGPGWGYPGLPYGPYVGFPWVPPGASGSFWTNGLSLYGPPVPTYGPTPGAFNGSDAGKQFFRNPPPAAGVWAGVGWGGYRSPSPRPFPPSVSVWPQPADLAIPRWVDADRLPPPADPTCIRLAIRVPDPAAVVWVEKKEMAAKGTERVFESPPLKPGEKYRYDLIAQWTENGQSKAESRSVRAAAGEIVVIDFTRPQE